MHLSRILIVCISRVVQNPAMSGMSCPPRVFLASNRHADQKSVAPGQHDFHIDVTPVEKLLRRTPVIGVGVYRCPVSNPQFYGGGPELCPYIVFSRSSVRLQKDGAPAEACTPNTVNMWNVGDSYRRKPISAEGVRCDYLAFKPSMLREIASEFDARKIDTDDIFDRAIAPIGPKLYVAQRTLFKALHEDTFIPDIAIEEAALSLLRAVLRETTIETPPAQANDYNSASAEGRMRAAVEETKSILSNEYWTNPSIAKLASRVHCSTAHLSREFKRRSGYTVHQYQQQLRIRASLQLLCDTRFNGAAIASQLGFATHSHFSDVFRRYFGMTPKAFASKRTLGNLSRMHAILDASFCA